MNAKQFLCVLLAITFFVVGCKPENPARSAVNNTPALQQSIQLSEPEKVILADPTINLERLGHITLAGNTLVATTNFSNTSRPISIDIGNGQVQGLQEPLRVALTGTSSVRYIPRRTSYEKDNHSVGELFLYDLQHGTEFQIANNQPGLASVAGNTVAWVGLGEGGWNIYAYDVTAQQTVTVTHGAGARAYPHISDSWVIYLDMGQEAILHAYNLATQEHLTLGPTAYPQYDSFRAGKHHLISDGKVIWADAATYDLHVFDLNTRATEVITDPVTTCKPLYELASMVGHTLLYTGCKGRALYDLDRKANVDIPAGGGWIVMSESRVVWQEGNDLYTARIER
jgi:hypothetical protein